jgi:hypothetical protein
VASRFDLGVRALGALVLALVVRFSVQLASGGHGKTVAGVRSSVSSHRSWKAREQLARADPPSTPEGTPGSNPRSELAYSVDRSRRSRRSPVTEAGQDDRLARTSVAPRAASPRSVRREASIDARQHGGTRCAGEKPDGERGETRVPRARRGERGRAGAREHERGEYGRGSERERLREPRQLVRTLAQQLGQQRRDERRERECEREQKRRGQRRRERGRERAIALGRARAPEEIPDEQREARQRGRR